MSTLDPAAVVGAVKKAPPDRSWVDGALDRGDRAQASVDWTKVRAAWRRAFVAMLLVVPLVVGWIAGRVVTGAVYAVAAVQEGYTRGRAATPRVEGR